MTRPIDVVLVTGFLGSGKTTFINRLIAVQPPEIRLAVLMNEFAEIGVDAALIDRRQGMAVVEVRKGSIFCICARSEFIRGLDYVADQLQPDRLVIEATGVADPGGIHKDLALEMFKGRFRFVQQICLVDTVHFEAAYHVYQAVERQIAFSDLFVLNKVDLAQPGQLDTVRRLIAGHHPAPWFVEAVQAAVPLDMILAAPRPAAPDAAAQQSADRRPPDAMVSAVYAWNGKTRTELERCLAALPRSLPRIKGFVELDGGSCVVEAVMGRINFAPAARPIAELPPELRNRLVIITAQIDQDSLKQIGAGSNLLVLQSVHQPTWPSENFDSIFPVT